MKRVIKWCLWLLFALGVVLTFVYLWRKGQTPEESYQEIEVSLGDSIVKQVTLSGNIKPRDEVSIKPQIAGIISEILVAPGDDVKRGDVLAKISVIPEMQQINNAESTVEQNKIVLDRLSKVYKRDQALFDKGLISREEYEKTTAELAQARLQLRTAEEALQITRSGVSSRYSTQSSTLVRATIDGKVLSIPVKVGSSVIQTNSFNEGTTIATIADMKDLIFEGNADETEVGRLALGQTMQISVGAVSGLHLTASLEYIAPQGTLTNGSMLFPIKGKLLSNGTQADSRLRAGFSATADVITESVRGVMTLPEACISYRGDSAFVQVVDPKQPKLVVERRVYTGLSDGAKIEIKQGLKRGERVRSNSMIAKD